jgi:hypothetical protein
MTRTAAALRRLIRPHVRGRVLAVLLACAGAICALAAAGIASAPGLLGILAAWAAILAVLAAAAWLARRVWRAAEPARVAGLVERTGAMRPGSMVSRVAPPGGAAASPELFQVADEQGSRTIEGSAASVHRVLRRQTTRDVGLGLVAAVLGAGIFVMASPDRSGAAAFWDPLRAIRDARSPVRLTVDRLVVPRGDSITASIVVLAAPDAMLWTRNPGEPWRSSSIALADDGTATRRIGPLTADLHIRVTSGSRRSRTLTVAVTNPPFLAELALTARFPSYLRRGDEPVMTGPDTVLLPTGTTILTRGTASASLTSAQWSAVSPDRRVGLDVRGSGFEGRLTPQASGAWQLSLSGLAGPLEGDPPLLIVRLVPDSAPVVQLPVPGADTVLPVSLRQLLVVDARDDHGLTQLALVSRRVSRTGVVAEPVTQRLEIPDRAGNRALLDVVLDLRDRGLFPGDTVRVLAEARDNAPSPRVGRSAELALRLPTMEELRAQARTATRDVLMAAESLTAAQQAIGEQARDLSQGRSRDPAAPGGARFPAGAAPQSGALPYAARERAEEVARQQADLAQRITELREAVEEIARAARAAGVGDTAFAARLAEVRELLRRAVTPELEARIRELQQALSRLDPDATRDALRRLVEAQEELRKELERSRELFQRAAIEGELASLAADAEALRQRQQDWNRTDARRADRAAAMEERELARLTDSLGNSLERLRRDVESGSEPGRVGRSRDAAQRAESAMRQAADAAQASDAQGAVDHGHRAAAELEHVPEALEAARESLAATWKRETMEALERALAETAVLAERQEEVLDALRRGEAGSTTRARQAALEEGSRAVARQIREAASRNALVPPALERALAYTEHQMRAARQQLEQGNPVAATAEPLARDALEGLNATINAIARSRAEVSGARTGSGLQEAIEQLTRLAGQQQGLNSDAQGLLPMMGPGGQAALMQQLRGLAARQRALAQQLERLQAGGMSGAAGPLADEARDLARRLEQGSLDQVTVERQERLYRRLLDAGRTLSGDEPDEGKERASRSASDTTRPQDGRAARGFEPGARLRYPTWEELRGLSAEERRLVLEYFRLLNEPR